MGARKKLNGAYFLGSALLAAAVGAVTQSWLVFIVALVVLVAVNLVTREIRPR